MITQVYANLAQSLLNASPGSGSLSVSLPAGYGSLFPTTYPYTCKIEEFNSSNQVTKREIVTVTNNASDVLTITRAVEPCPASYTATTQTQIAYSFAITGGFTSVITQIDSAKNLNDRKLDLNAKLDASGGLRTGMGLLLQDSEFNTSGVEILKSISGGASILSADLLRVYDPSTRTRKEVPYSFIENSISQGGAQDNVAGEALTVNDACLYEIMFNSVLVTSSGVGKYLLTKMGDVAGNTRRSMKIVGNGISASTLKLGLGKTGAPSDNLIVRIETDSAGLPSGTLAHANATSNVDGTGLTTGIVDTTVTFGGAFTLTANTLYHVVIQRQNEVDPSNYYILGGVTRNVRMLKVNSHNGTSWQTESAVISLYMIYGGAYSRYIVKCVSNLTELNWFDGIATSTVALGASVKINREGLMSGFSGLTEGAPYYITTTPGALTTTGTAINRSVGYAVGTTKMYIRNPLTNQENFEYSLDNALYVLNEGAIQGGQISMTFRATSRFRIGSGMTFSGGNGTFQLYINNTLARNISSSSIPLAWNDVYPGDLVTFNWYVVTGAYGRVIAYNTPLAPLAHYE